MRHWAIHPLLIPAVLAAAVGGYLLGARHGRAPAPQRTGSPTRVLSDAGLLLEYPLDWRKVGGVKPPKGLALMQTISLLPPGADPGEGLLVGRLPAGEPAPLPVAFSARLAALPHTEVVSLTSTPAYRYSKLRLKDGAGALTLYVVAGSSGSPPRLLACSSAGLASPVQRACEEVVAGVETLGDPALPITPEASYAARLAAVLRGLQRERATIRHDLAASRSAATIQGLAERLAGRFSSAAAAMSAIEAPQVAAGAQQALASALSHAGQSYSTLAADAGSGGIGPYDEAQAQVREAESEVDRALASFSLLGYGSA
jgi:hypothetical protein